MPKQTFFNLPGEKREAILGVAVEEFADKGYSQASITQIVARAGIAKGSFYQYFEDKDDLFLYIVETFIAQRKIQVFQEEKEKLKDLNLTEFLRVAFHRQVSEFLETPQLLKIGLDLVSLMNTPVYHRLLERYQGSVDSYFIPFIQYEMAQGEIDSRINIRILNFMLVSLGQYLSALLAAGQVTTVSHELVDDLVNDLDYILTHGIYGKAGG